MFHPFRRVRPVTNGVRDGVHIIIIIIIIIIIARCLVKPTKIPLIGGGCCARGFPKKTSNVQ
jgi:hypothetical protein